MKNPLKKKVCRLATLLALLVGSTLSVRATPPKLTDPGVIAAIKAKTYPNLSHNIDETYNLGPTGLRGWTYMDPNNAGHQGIITAESREILVATVSAPASQVLQVDDVIVGVSAAETGEVSLFISDCRQAFGQAISAAEAVGTLRVRRWRKDVGYENVNITLAKEVDYQPTAPFNCIKSSKILAAARTKLISETSDLSADQNGAISALALLASSPSDLTTDTVVQTRLKNFAHRLAPSNLNLGKCDTWKWGYIGIFLSEYYLKTVADSNEDKEVLHGIIQYTEGLAKAQSRYGTFGAGGSVPDANSIHGTVPPYGPLNSAGIPANIAIILGKKALSKARTMSNPTLGPESAEINDAIIRGSNFYNYYVNKGPIPYGEHPPYLEAYSGHASNGKDAMCAVMFGIQDNRPEQTEYFTRMAIAGYTGIEYGHTGQGFGYLWGALGANVGGNSAVTEYMEKLRWHFDLARRTDGSFTYDGSEQYGGGFTEDKTYLGKSNYEAMSSTASYILSYSLALKQLYITGKKDVGSTDYTLSPAKLTHAISAASCKKAVVSYTMPQLYAALSDYDPVVRNDAANELGSRAVIPGEINTLSAMVSNTSPGAAYTNGRMGACQVLGILRDLTALPLLSLRLSDTDLWVRAKAAEALRQYGIGAKPEVNQMLTAFAANATNPDVVAWIDPIQISNGVLSSTLIAGGIAAETLKAPEGFLYPAVKVGLIQPDARARMGFAKFTNDLSLADARVLTPDLFQAAKSTAQADTMFQGSARAHAVNTLTNFKMAEAIPIALDLTNTLPEFGWNSFESRIPALAALATFGDAARWTLPTLRGYSRTWSKISTEYRQLAVTIASIENANTSPAGITNFAAVADSKMVVIPTSVSKIVTLSGSSCRGASLTYINGIQPTHGTLTWSPPNVTYMPFGSYTGPDYFTYQVSDGLTTSEAATVSIILGNAGTGLKGEYFDQKNFTNLLLTRTDPEVNFDWGNGSPATAIGSDTFSVHWSGLLLVPESKNYTFSTLSSDGIQLYVNGLLVLDSLSDQSTQWRDSITIPLTAGQMVEVFINYYENTGDAVAKLKWTGPSFAGKNGAIIGKEWLFDGSSVATRNLFAHAQNLSILENTSQNINLSTNFNNSNYIIVDSPTHGSLEQINFPSLVYKPNPNFNGMDSFTFKVTNGSLVSEVVTVTIKVVATNSMPSAQGQAVTAARGMDKKVVLSGSDLDGDTLTYRILSRPTNGSLEGDPPNITYRSNAGYLGTDSFSFVANDGALDSQAETVEVTVIRVNDKPVAIAQSVSTVQNIDKLVTLAAYDVNGDNLNYTIVRLPAHGSLVVNFPGVTYKPAAGYNGVDSFTFKANDGLEDSAPARVNVTVAGNSGINTWTNANGGNWSLASNWNVSPTSADSTILAFNIAGNYSAVCDASVPFTLNQLLLGGDYVTIGGNMLELKDNNTIPAQINQNSNKTVVVSSPLSFASTVDVGGSGAGELALTGAISGAGGMTKTSLGNLKLSAPGSTISGLTNVIDGSLLQSGGTMVSDRVLIDGGSMTVTGGTTKWSQSFDSQGITVGAGTSGNSLTITNGAELLPNYDRQTMIGMAAGSNNNIVTISGNGSALGNSKKATALYVGSAHSNSDTSSYKGGNGNEVRVLAGAKLFSGTSRQNRSVIGTNSRDNKVTVDGSGSVWNIHPGNLYLGYGGSEDINNSLVISNGGQVNMLRTRWVVRLALDWNLAPQFANIGNANQATANYVMVTGTGSKWDLREGQINIGSGGWGDLSAGNGGATAGTENQLIVSNGGMVKNVNWLMVGNSSTASNNNSVLLKSGGILDMINSGGIVVGSASASGNRINVNSGGILQFHSKLPSISINSDNGNKVVFKNGTLSYQSVFDADMGANKTTGIGVGKFLWTGLNTLRLDNSTDTFSTPYTFANDQGPTNYTGLELLGDTVISRAITLDGLHGGSLSVMGATATVSGGITLMGPVSITATEASSIVTSTLSGSGDLVKSGSAMLTLNGTPNYSGNTTVSAGTLQFTNANTNNQSSTVTISATGATLELGFSGTDTVGQLVIGNTRMAAGVYKSSTNTGVGKVIPQLTGTGTLTVLTQVIPPASYQAWALTQGFTAGTNDGSMLDPDGDGISNLMEYVLNGVPIIPSRTILPTLKKSATGWVFMYERNDVSLTSGTRQFVDYGSDLVGWTSVEILGVSGGIVSITPGSPTDRVSVAIPANGSQVFVRLKVVQ